MGSSLPSRLAGSYGRARSGPRSGSPGNVPGGRRSPGPAGSGRRSGGGPGPRNPNPSGLGGPPAHGVYSLRAGAGDRHRAASLGARDVERHRAGSLGIREFEPRHRAGSFGAADSKELSVARNIFTPLQRQAEKVESTDLSQVKSMKLGAGRVSRGCNIDPGFRAVRQPLGPTTDSPGFGAFRNSMRPARQIAIGNGTKAVS